MKQIHPYSLRPVYGGDELLIEFTQENSNSNLISDLKYVCSEINFELNELDDLWMNDEVILTLNSNFGEFILTKDIWDFYFIMAKNNQEVIVKIDEILSSSEFFEKKKVDFSEYK
jgi:hypothetical protein